MTRRLVVLLVVAAVASLSACARPAPSPSPSISTAPTHTPSANPSPVKPYPLGGTAGLTLIGESWSASATVAVSGVKTGETDPRAVAVQVHVCLTAFQASPYFVPLAGWRTWALAGSSPVDLGAGAWPSPLFPKSVPIAAGQCISGWLDFELPAGVRLSGAPITYTNTTDHRVLTWRAP